MYQQDCPLRARDGGLWVVLMEPQGREGEGDRERRGGRERERERDSAREQDRG